MLVCVVLRASSLFELFDLLLSFFLRCLSCVCDVLLCSSCFMFFLHTFFKRKLFVYFICA